MWYYNTASFRSIAKGRLVAFHAPIGYETFRLVPMRGWESAMARLIFMLCLGAMLAACGRNEETRSPADTQPAPSGEVVAADEYGPFDAPVADIAFWTHPSLSFRGLVLVATSNGVAAYNIEDGAEVARIDGIEAGGIDVVYAGSGAAARGLAIVHDRETGAFRVFEIDNETRSLAPLPSSGAAGPRDAAFCAGPRREGAPLLIELNGKNVKSYSLDIRQDDVGFDPSGTRRAREEIVACLVDPLDGTVFLAGRSGAVFRMSVDGAIATPPFAKLRIEDPKAIGLALGGLVEGGPTEECCGEIAVLDAADAGIHVLDRDDASPIGTVRIASSFDVEGVSTATAMGVGYGNFGGIYRDGVVALATDGEKPAVRLVPLNGVMDALSAPMGPTAEPRALSPKPAEEDGLIIDVDLVPSAPR